ncbi:Uncharacterised protein [Actinobaculum suis]|uniref:Uncharacterized protein n=1 Tax=Actinobaculum suis TaxID=1657 RepID=A0A7Z8YAP6_9ACTO|nr:Uncharacterised protein [Actinobaculum suis]
MRYQCDACVYLCGTGAAFAPREVLPGVLQEVRKIPSVHGQKDPIQVDYLKRKRGGVFRHFGASLRDGGNATAHVALQTKNCRRQ